ncbi:MAG: D-alanyl-D-alanine carboxypeptidase/D-alanyl-D-alanine-endopeptidase [Prevotella sp.]|nr:D-alanyl-D-alanine carboxypeptidase/D-alanyl-D-alanine-endopeptidase [Prevotella sp.]
MKIRTQIFIVLLLLSVPLLAQEEPMVSELPQATEDGLVWPQSMQQRLDEMMRHPLTETTQLGLMVWDLTDDRSLFSCNHRQLLRPASTMKLLTAITALDQLGPAYNFFTRLYTSGERVDHVFHGDVCCVGGMDPLFSFDDMRSFVDALKSTGIDSLCGRIVTDVSMKDTLRWGEGWCWDDKNPTLTPLLVGRKDIFAPTLANLCEEAGIAVMNNFYIKDQLPKDAVLVAERRTPLTLILQQMMKDSDNLFAESVFYQVAASSGHRPARAIDAIRLERALMERAGLESKQYRLADGSGLSLYNYLSAEAEVRLLRYAYRNKRIFNTLYDVLPIAGVDGTLKKRMKGTAAASNVRAKTGTLTGVISLSGYATAPNGHLLCFAIMNQGTLKAADARSFQDQVCQIICEP